MMREEKIEQPDFYHPVKSDFEMKEDGYMENWEGKKMFFPGKSKDVEIRQCKRDRNISQV